MNVHTHGPDEGRGLDCGEIRLADGSPLGWCQLLPVIRKAKVEAWAEGAEAAAMAVPEDIWHALELDIPQNPYTEES